MAPCSDVINVLLNILDLDTLALAHVRKRRPILAHFPLKFYYLLDLEDPLNLQDRSGELLLPGLTPRTPQLHPDQHLEAVEGPLSLGIGKDREMSLASVHLAEHQSHEHPSHALLEFFDGQRDGVGTDRSHDL